MPWSSARTRRSIPSSTAGAIIILASCPPPITPTRTVIRFLSSVPISSGTILPHPKMRVSSARGIGPAVGVRAGLGVTMREDLIDLDLIRQHLVHEIHARHEIGRAHV